MKEVIKYLKVDLKEYRQFLKQAIKDKEWQTVTQFAAIIEYIECSIDQLEARIYE